MEFISTLEKLDSRVWEYYLSVPEEVANHFIEGQNRRIVTTFNGTVTVNNSIMFSEVGNIILVNKKIRTRLGLMHGDEVSVKVEKDQSQYGLPMPESFEALLDQDDEGSVHFHALTPGKQRSLIYIITQVKNVDSRINKGLAILSHLKEQNGTLDFKKLNERIKEYNQRGKLNH